MALSAPSYDLLIDMPGCLDEMLLLPPLPSDHHQQNTSKLLRVFEAGCRCMAQRPMSDS